MNSRNWCAIQPMLRVISHEARFFGAQEMLAPRLIRRSSFGV